MAESKATANIDKNASSATPSPIVIDLGKQRGKKVKKLLRGEGSLFYDVQDAVEDLRGVGKIKPDAQLVFVKVEKKRKRNSLDNCFGILN